MNDDFKETRKRLSYFKFLSRQGELGHWILHRNSLGES